MLEAIILGIVQGLTEFLPISSSGHLVLAENILGVLDHDKQDVLFEVVLHLGTLVAILIAYRQDIIDILQALPGFIPGIENKPKSGNGLLNDRHEDTRKLIINILIASIPAGLIGVLLKDFFTSAFSRVDYVGVLLLVTAVILLIGDRLKKSDKIAEAGGPGRSFLIGVAQAFAILPGISRSGSTIVCGMLMGLKPTEAARFSFLISIPAIGGAALLEVLDLLSGQSAALHYSAGALLAGFLSSAIVGYLALQWLLIAVRKRSLTRFAIYCIAVGLLSLVWQFA
jgi:undecaprenyl-diphosphatase